MSAEAVRAEIAALQAKSPLWQFRANCLYYCRFVHAHHGGEDHLLFPLMRRTNPELGGVMDRLEADHRQIAVHLDEIEGWRARSAVPTPPRRGSGWSRRCTGSPTISWRT